MSVSAFSDVVRARVMARSGGVCEACGMARAEQLHHRKPRRAGGSRVPEIGQAANALALDSDCHDRIESRREWATRLGFLISQWGPSPCEVPVFRLGRWVLLSDDGGLAPAVVAS